MNTQESEVTSNLLDDVISAVNDAPRPVWLWDLETERVVAISASASELLHVHAGETVTDTLALSDEREADERRRDLLRRGDISGYAAVVGAGSDGDVVDRMLWVRALRTEASYRYAVTIPTDLRPSVVDAMRAVADIGATVGSVDNEGRIVQISADVMALLGYEPMTLVSRPLLELIDPTDGGAVERAFMAARDTSVNVIAPVRRADGASQRISLTIGPRHGERRVFVMSAFVAGALEMRGGRTDAERVAELERHLERIGREVEAAGLAAPSMRYPDLTRFPSLADLTSRQWQVLVRLLQGARIGTIASEMHLSASTVRNHLSVVYRKLGVHSQRELIEKLGAVDDSEF